MRANDIEQLSHLLEKNAGFVRPEGQTTGFTLQDPAGESNEGGAAAKPSSNQLAPVPAVSIPSTVVDKQLNLPVSSLSKKQAARSRREKDIFPTGNDLWSQEELEMMMKTNAPIHAAVTAAVAAAGGSGADNIPAVVEAKVGLPMNREEPVYTVLQQQKITAEDVYLGVDFTRDAGSSDGVVVKVQMPKLEKSADLAIHVEPFQLYVSSPDYYLNAALPRRCVAGKAEAAWDEKKKSLEVRLVADTTDDVKMI